MPNKPKGLPKTGGRKKGAQNKVTATAREAIAQFVEGNVDRLTLWLDRIAADSPKEAFSSFMSVVEYHIPKLARTDIQGLDKNGEKSDGLTITINHIKPSERN